MALQKIPLASIGLLFLGHLLSGVASLETCETILPENTVGKLGEKGVIKCRQASQQISWTFCPRNGAAYQIANNCNVVQSAIGRYRLDKSANSCNLVINNVTANDLGTYTCQDLTVNDRGHAAELGNTNENFALHKKAIQSSTYANTYVANFAVDGNTDGNFGKSSCACTQAIAPVTWWAVDLEQEVSIGRVRISNRADAVPERLQQFFIGLTNVSPWNTAPVLSQSSVCKYYYGFPLPGDPLDIFCEPNTLPGRYLFVMFKRADYLTICELEAYYK